MNRLLTPEQEDEILRYDELHRIYSRKSVARRLGISREGLRKAIQRALRRKIKVGKVATPVESSVLYPLAHGKEKTSHTAI
jgi:predicted DNA-binding protein (UPF0251 family)